MEKKKFYFMIPGDVYAMDFWAESECEVRVYIKKILGVNRMPRGVEIWSY